MPKKINLHDLLGDSAAELVIEGLYRLLEIKKEALAAVRQEGVMVDRRQFEPRDFGIPQIEALLARFDGDDEESAEEPATAAASA